MAVRYECAPIVEAIIEIQVPSEHGVSVERIDSSLSPLVRESYPKKYETSIFQGQFRLGPNTGAAIESAKTGVDFHSSDGKQIFVAHAGRFAFSRLAPYGTWQEIKEEARRLWEMYRSVVPVTKISRVAVRYVNKIQFPPGNLEFHDYLNTYPRLTPEAPDLVNNFFMRLEIPQPDINASAIVILANAQGVDDGVAMILDIDVFKQAEAIADVESIWVQLERLRERKNLYFEKTITDATRRLFGERTEY